MPKIITIALQGLHPKGVTSTAVLQYGGNRAS